MSTITGVVINKTTGKLTAGPDGSDRILGLLALCAVAPSGLAFGTSKALTAVSDAEAVGIDATYDTTNSEVLYHNITEFFRLSPKGKLWLMVVNSTNMPGAALDDTTVTMTRKLINDAGGEIRVLGMQINNAVLAGTWVNGIPTEISAAIPKAQTFADWCYTNHKPVNVLLEGCNVAADITTLGNLRAISGVTAFEVSLVIGQDKAITDKGAAWSKRAAIGATLGMISARAVNENIGWIEKGNLQNVSASRFLAATISNGTTVESNQANWQTHLEDKGYIFILPYTGIDGYYFNNDHTCCALTHDEAFVSRGRVKNKAARVIRTALLPKVKSPQPVDAATGKLPQSVVEYFNALGEKAVDSNLTNNNEISGRKVRVDPDSDLVNSPRKLKIAFAIVPYGEVGEIEGTLEFTSATNIQ